MVIRESHCVGCPKEMGCLGDACPNMNVPVLICDVCKEEVDELYEWDFDDDKRCRECMDEVAGIRKVEI